MLEYFNFFLLCTIFTLIFYLYIRTKKYFPILKMAEELIGNLGYGTRQSDTKRQKLLECVLTGNSKLYLGKVYTEEKINPLHAKGEKSRQYGNSSTHYEREKSTKNHQSVSEGISWEARIISSHTAAQKIARKLSFQVTKNYIPKDV